MMKKKRILAAAAAVILVLCFIFAASLNVFATDFVYTTPYIVDYNGTDVDQGVNTLEDYYLIYINTLNVYKVSVFYFELIYEQIGIERPSQINYMPSDSSWNIPYSIYSENIGSFNPILRFYVTSPSWNFQLRRTSNNTVFFDSSSQTAVSMNNGVYYYTFTFDGLGDNLIPSSQGWYIYSDEYVPDYNPIPVDPDPDPDPEPSFADITVNYVNNGTVVYTFDTSVGVTTFPFYLPIPAINNYIISDSVIRDNGYFFPIGISGDTTISIDVISYSAYTQQAYNNGLHTGELNGYNVGYDVGYDEGYELGFEQGEEYGRAQAGSTEIQNPLLWVTSPVASFLKMQVYPGLSLGVLFLASIAISLVVIFLKIFAGG